jgi:hypothetical protein
MANYQKKILTIQQQVQAFIDAGMVVSDIAVDNYNCSAYYESSYVIARAYQNGGF